jgi:hypothetical protein
MGPQEAIDLEIAMSSRDYESQVFLYFAFDNFTSLAGNTTFSIHNYSAPDPIFLRYVADDLEPPIQLLVSFIFSGPIGRNPRADILLPGGQLQVCPWNPPFFAEWVAVALIVIASIFGAAFLVGVCALAIRSTEIVESEIPAPSDRPPLLAGLEVHFNDTGE